MVIRVQRRVAGMFRPLLPRRLWPRLLLLLGAATGPMLFLLVASAVQDGQAVRIAGQEQVVQLARLGALGWEAFGASTNGIRMTVLLKRRCR